MLIPNVDRGTQCADSYQAQSECSQLDGWTIPHSSTFRFRNQTIEGLVGHSENVTMKSHRAAAPCRRARLNLSTMIVGASQGSDLPLVLSLRQIFQQKLSLPSTSEAGLSSVTRISVFVTRDTQHGAYYDLRFAKRAPGLPLAGPNPPDHRPARL